MQAIAGATLRFGIWRNPEAPELYPIIKVSENLAKWSTATGAEVALVSGGNRLVFDLLPGAMRRFTRVEFIAP
jgi:hypothetical protein